MQYFLESVENALKALREHEQPVYSGRHSVDLISESLRNLKKEARKNELEPGHLLRALAEIAARAQFSAEDLGLVRRAEDRENDMEKLVGLLGDIYKRLCYYTEKRNVRTKPTQLGVDNGQFFMPYDSNMIERIREVLGE